MSTVMTATEAIKFVGCKTIKRSAATQQFPIAASPGDVFRQGDLYIRKLAKVPSRAVKAPVAAPSEPLQLAPGTTQGSRHIVDSREGVTVYNLEEPTALDGPILSLTKDRVVTHPEHGHVRLNAGDIYAITYQRAFAEELRRVQD